MQTLRNQTQLAGLMHTMTRGVDVRTQGVHAQVKKARTTPEGALKQMPVVPDLPSRSDMSPSAEVKRSMSAANLHKACPHTE